MKRPEIRESFKNVKSKRQTKPIDREELLYMAEYLDDPEKGKTISEKIERDYEMNKEYYEELEKFFMAM